MAHACNCSTLQARGGQITKSRHRDHPGQHGETLSLLKIQKLAGHDGIRLQSQLLGRLRQENHLNLGGRSCSELRSHHCNPAWRQSEIPSQNIDSGPFFFLPFGSLPHVSNLLTISCILLMQSSAFSIILSPCFSFWVFFSDLSFNHQFFLQLCLICS